MMKRITTLLLVALALLGATYAMLGTSGVAGAQGEKGVAMIEVQPLTPKPGETITVKGDQLGANGTVEVRLIGNGVDVDLGEVGADRGGAFSAQFVVPANLEPGTYKVQATGAGSAVAEITIVGVGAGGAEAATTGTGTGTSSAEMGAAPVLRERPLGESIILIAIFGLVAGLGIFLARTAPESKEGVEGSAVETVSR